MINSIKIQNFLSHKNTFLEFHPGVNVFVGLSDKGKSAAIKALYWAGNNRPAGLEMVSWWGGDTSVEVAMDNNKHIIERIKTENNENVYKYNLISNSYKAFGKSVPEEIKKAFNMGEINWLTQIEPPFLLHPGISPGKIAEELNRITNLSIINESLIRAKQEGKKTKTSIDINETLMTGWEEGLKKFNNLDEMEEKIAYLEQLAKSLNEKKDERASLAHLMETIIETKKRMLELIWIKEAHSNILKLMSFNKQMSGKRYEAGQIYKLLKDIKKSKGKLKHIQHNLKAKKEIDSIFLLSEKIEKKRKKVERLSVIINEIQEMTKALKQTISELKKKEKQFHELFPNQCPLCGYVKKS